MGTACLLYFYRRYFITSQIWILFEIHTEAIVISALLSYGAYRCLSPLLFCFLPEIWYIIEGVKLNHIEFYVFLKIYCITVAPLYGGGGGCRNLGTGFAL